MKKGATFLILLLLAGMLAYRFVYRPQIKEKQLQEQLLLTSDANQFERTITVWGDDWLGYLIFKSRQMQQALHRSNLGIRYENVLDYGERLEGLANGKCDLITITLDSYLTNGSTHDYPGVILFMIDESFGGDAIIGGPGVKSLDALDEKGRDGAFVGHSPSEFLLKSSAAHFKLGNVSKNLHRYRKDSSTEALEALRKGKADYAVLWEPFASQALAQVPGSSLLIDTKQARGIILDAAVANRRTLAAEPELFQKLTHAYFQSLHYYLNRPEEFNNLASAYSGEDPTTASKMLGGIRFANLQDNRREWFGVESQGIPEIVDALGRIEKILRDSGDIQQDKLQGNYYSLIHSNILAGMTQSQGIERLQPNMASVPTHHYFPPLDPAAWDKIRGNVTGTFLNEPVLFKTGQASLTEEFQDKLHDAASKLVHYPYHRIVIEANVSPGQDPQVDLQLSEQRALAIKGYLVGSSQVEENRILAKGLGSQGLPAKYPGEADRAWKRRCRRAKIFLVMDAGLRSGAAALTPNGP